MSTNPTAVAAVNASSRISTPSSTATAGFTYVITVDRAGPTSAMSWKKTRNATAVQITARPSTASVTRADGQAPGASTMPAGR